ncbi:RNA polymerase-associated protein CTR9 homolog isoform X1 [Drosophila novamexicana]|uniref:RNA polymerase-associated protein CTR9 homolog isoform X1 n=2 Tax=Drosophila novamexicana TaxID=47314 RepID=UPI0011E5DD4A|nr:RNA polymerase-associated protein CTR9 homolog isoform X1 [Drosophila novamexicana]
MEGVENHVTRAFCSMSNKIGKIETAQQSRNSGQVMEPLCDVQEVLNALCSKRVKLREWIQKAWAYYHQNQFEGFVLLLENAITRGFKTYPGYKEDLLKIHTLLAAHFFRLACSEHGNRRAMWQEKVSQQLQIMDSMQLVSNDLPHLLCRGFALMLTEARLQDADNHFVSVLRQMPYSVPALLGRACLAYNRQEYRVALGYFKSVLQHHPHGPADVRVGIAHCFLQMGDLDSARRAFEMAVQRNGRCINALLGIAQLKLNERQRAANMEATNLLCAAFELNHRHPVVLSWLACYLYYSRNYGKMQTAAGNAYLITDNPLLKAQNCFLIARSFHAQSNFDRAFDFYGKALKCLSEYAPPYLGIAQMYVRRGQLDLAEHSLRSLLKLLPDNPHGLRMLATLYAQADSPGKLDKAIQLFKSALERPGARDDYDTWLGLAGTYGRLQLWGEAIDAYEQAVSIYLRLQKTTKEAPIAWLNNVAALQLHAGQPEAALQTLDKALSTNPKGATQEHSECNILTMRFNRARVLEELHLADRAEDSYKQLIAEYPNYYDSYLRLGIMAKDRNQIIMAMEYFKAVLQLENDNVAARTYLGNLYAKQGALSQAMCNYNVIMRRPGSFGDSYMLVAVGNVCLVKVQRTTANGQLEMAKQYQENALQLFRKALEQNQRNLWAANGIGVALSNHGHLADGESIFKQIVESSKRCTEAILNTAHIAMEQEHYTEAIDIYKQCLKEFLPSNSVKEMHLLAKALYQTGQFEEAKQLLQKARHVAPQDLMILYNLGIVIKQDIRETYGKQRTDRTELQRAEKELNMAQSIFQYLGGKEESLQTAYKQANKCSKLLANVLEDFKNLSDLDEVEKKTEERQKAKRDKAKAKESSRKKDYSKKREQKETETEVPQKSEKEEPMSKDRYRRKDPSKKSQEKISSTDEQVKVEQENSICTEGLRKKEHLKKRQEMATGADEQEKSKNDEKSRKKEYPKQSQEKPIHYTDLENDELEKPLSDVLSTHCSKKEHSKKRKEKVYETSDRQKIEKYESVDKERSRKKEHSKKSEEKPTDSHELQNVEPEKLVCEVINAHARKREHPKKRQERSSDAEEYLKIEDGSENKEYPKQSEGKPYFSNELLKVEQGSPISDVLNTDSLKREHSKKHHKATDADDPQNSEREEPKSKERSRKRESSKKHHEKPSDSHELQMVEQEKLLVGKKFKSPAKVVIMDQELDTVKPRQKLNIEEPTKNTAIEMTMAKEEFKLEDARNEEKIKSRKRKHKSKEFECEEESKPEKKHKKSKEKKYKSDCQNIVELP